MDTTRLPITTWVLSTMSGQDESTRLFQKMVVFKYVVDNRWKQSKDILVNRDTVAQYEVCGVIVSYTSPLVLGPTNMAAV